MHRFHRDFFFQAEDGIRDDLVTGVQTCALPISLRQNYGCGYSGLRHYDVEVYGTLSVLRSTLEFFRLYGPLLAIWKFDVQPLVDHLLHIADNGENQTLAVWNRFWAFLAPLVGNCGGLLFYEPERAEKLFL